jgi:hypothetical protein
VAVHPYYHSPLFLCCSTTMEQGCQMGRQAGATVHPACKSRLCDACLCYHWGFHVRARTGLTLQSCCSFVAHRHHSCMRCIARSAGCQLSLRSVVLPVSAAS